MTCDLGEATESLENEISVASPTSQLILQPFRRFIYITAHSPNLPLLHLSHRSFSNSSFVSPESQALHLRHWRAAHGQVVPFRTHAHIKKQNNELSCVDLFIVEKIIIKWNKRYSSSNLLILSLLLKLEWDFVDTLYFERNLIPPLIHGTGDCYWSECIRYCNYPCF